MKHGNALRIAVMRDRYPTAFNTPRISRHLLTPQIFVPTHRISMRIESVTMFPPLPGFDLVHTYNRIPLGTKPFVIGFESHLPRYWWGQDDRLFRFYARQLARDRCRAIVATSHAAARTFEAQHADNPIWPDLKRKLSVIHPNIHIPECDDALTGDSAESLRVTFVGGHFARKGGCVAVRVAERARELGLPIHVTVVSTLQVGGDIWTDPVRTDFFERYFKLLDAPNVTFLRGAPNSEVLALLANSHLSLLPTFGDTFGYSAIESMMMYTPVIGTDQGALPEFIDEENGFLLDLETSHIGEWVHSSGKRDSAKFEATFTNEVERLTEETLNALRSVLGQPERLAKLRAKARVAAVRTFDTKRLSPIWDDLYDHAAQMPLGRTDEAA